MTNKTLGYLVSDRITGFTGIAIGHVEYLTGCNQTLVVPRVGGDGAIRAGEWFDDQRLQFSASGNGDVAPGERIVLDNGSTPGCDAPPSRRY
jgi:hypothetical protein